MDIAKLLELTSAAGQSQRASAGQVTLGHLRDVLALLPPEMPCRYDTGHHFGLSEVVFSKVPEDRYEDFHWPEHDVASSKTAYPSCYRGYYSDCTFNASTDYEESTVGHVLEMVNGAIGKTFDGYKGGLNDFTEGTPVWGGGASHSECSTASMVVGIEVIDEVCVLKTRVQDDDA